MFSWAGTIYLYNGNSLISSVIYSLIWGFVGMFLVSYVIYKLLKFQETGNSTVWTAIGEDATVYMDIPENGTGKVRVLVSGAISFIDAKGSQGRAIPSGTHVRVVHVLDEKTLEVEAV
jgi:membrane protein implicated in regulation of membrane protease activity